ncbi:MAG: carboxypeptidase-like regulatory domain-containing protein, partial [Paucibacter sp.]|nr:carboxypeptidase-like regulatory domain-containing protein [Roseateles sp.]
MSDHRSLRAMRISAVAQALALAFGAASLNLALAPAVRAQSNATSTIYGQLPPGEGLSVLLKNLATGVQRTLQPDANGRFQATSMPPGRYQVQLLRGSAVEKSQEVEALVGQGVEANFVTINSLDTVRVSGGVK